VLRGGVAEFMDHVLVLSGQEWSLLQYARILLVSQKMSGERAVARGLNNRLQINACNQCVAKNRVQVTPSLKANKDFSLK
jgi:hypothetical protein